MRRSQGMRVGTRHRLRVKPHMRGMPPITKILQQFEEGDKAAIVIDGRVLKGQPHSSFHGRTGTIVGKQGSAYYVEVRIGGLTKKVLCAPVHLKKLQ
ncbi:MAG: 50S ribosomal protein L21e [Thermoplasmata archaeon]